MLGGVLIISNVGELAAVPQPGKKTSLISCRSIKSIVPGQSHDAFLPEAEATGGGKKQI